MSSHLSYAEALIVGALQGVTELFPVSSLGHSVLLPAIIGGRWAADLNVSTPPESPYLAFIVGLHVATAAALLVFFWRDWVRIVSGGFVTSVRYRRIQTPAERLAWLIVLATIPVGGLSGLALEHVFRTTLGKPVPAAVFLILNGLVLYGGEMIRRRTPALASVNSADSAGQRESGSLGNAVDDRSPNFHYRTAFSSAAPKFWHCCPASVARASPWSPAWRADCPTRKRRGSPSFWRHR